MSKLKFALAMLAAGGAVAATSEASAATVILDIDSHADLTDISLEGGPAQFFYAYDSTVDKTYLGAYGSSLLQQPSPPFGSGGFSNQQVKTAYGFTFKGPPAYKGIGFPGDGFVNLKFTEGAQGYHGFADITSDGTLHAITYSAGIPEPAAWGLMLAGFGLTGAALRRTRRQAAALSA